MTHSVIIGAAIGLLAALMQSLSYIASKVYINRGGTPFALAVYSQIIMAVIAGAMLFILRDSFAMPLTLHFALVTVICVGSAVIGHFSFFRAVKHIETSRLSSLMGMKIIVIAFLSATFQGHEITLMQWSAVVLCSIAAAGMNFTGGRITKHGFLWLTITLAGYAISDIAVVKVINAMTAETKFMQSVSAVGVCYVLTGAGALIQLPFAPHQKRLFFNAAPYAVIWLGAMIFLFYCFQESGVIFGSIVQAMRGIFSVILGVILVKSGFKNIEPAVSRKAWIRRMIMAVLMVLAMALYVL